MVSKKRSERSDVSQTNTREKILHAAMKIFAERGYKDATTRMICAEARVNVALVNYYFSSKAELYRTVISGLFEDVGKPMLAIPETVRGEATWRQAIRTWVRRSLSICAANRPPESYAARLMGMEECVPSDMTQDIERKFTEPMRQCFARLIRMALPDADPMEISLWSSAVNAQSVVYALTKSSWAAKFCLPAPDFDREAWLDRVADHICDGIFCRLSFRKRIEENE